MAIVTAGLRLIYRCIVTAISLAIIYAICEALRQGEQNLTARALLVGVGALAIGWTAAAWSRDVAAAYVQVCAIPILAALYLFEVQHGDPIDDMLHTEQFWRLAKTKVASGQPFTIQYSPHTFVRMPNGGVDLPSGERVFPLGQVADLPTIMCREGARPFAEFEADERGFNNPKGIWGRPIDVMFIGDSMTYGACLPNRDHFVAQIRERFLSTLNLGAGGLGPLIELAQMREFVPKTKPKFIFYMYDENNDLYSIHPAAVPDIVLEYRNPILKKYLADDRFSQRIYERQPEINTSLKELVDKAIAAGLAERTLLKSLSRPLGLPFTRASLPSPPPSVEPAAPSVEPTATTPTNHRLDLGQRPGEPEIDGEAGHALVRPTDAAERDIGIDRFELFKDIFSKMVRVSTEAGAKFVFVNIPAYQTICDGIDHPWKSRVLDFVQSRGVDFIDLERDFKNADKMIGREELFSVPPCGGHFSERGYKVIGDRLLQYLEIQENGSVPAGWRVTTSPVQHDEPAATPKVLWTATGIYQPYVKFSAVLAPTSDVATRTEGASILGLPYKRHKGGNSLRITVKFTAYSLQDNEIVAALFIGDGSKSARISSQPVTAGSSASVMLTYDIDDLSDAPVNIEVRVGSRRPGELYINGDNTGPATSDLKTSLTVEEIGIKEMSLVYVGSALSQSELIEGRRRLAARMREPSPGILARTFEEAERWVIGKVSTTREFYHEQIYEPRAEVDRVIDADAVDLDGASIMGYAWKPKSPFDLVRVKVVVPAWTARPTSVVAALFVNQSVVPIKLASQELAPGKVAEAVLEFEMVAGSIEAMALEVRVGPGRPGVIYLNGNENGPDPDMPKPTLTIEEYRPFWR
jgi:hypothetical protein